MNSWSPVIGSYPISKADLSNQHYTVDPILITIILQNLIQGRPWEGSPLGRLSINHPGDLDDRSYAVQTWKMYGQLYEPLVICHLGVSGQKPPFLTINRSLSSPFQRKTIKDQIFHSIVILQVLESVPTIKRWSNNDYKNVLRHPNDLFKAFFSNQSQISISNPKKFTLNSLSYFYVIVNNLIQIYIDR